MISTVQPLRVLNEKKLSNEQELDLRSLLNTLIGITSGRRNNHQTIKDARGLYKRITKDMSKDQIKKWLREQPMRFGSAKTETQLRTAQATVVEKELASALNEHHSALMDQPFVEQQGKNDFLVMKKNKADPFVTVVPNAIYYNIEKKCVNWLDDCSLRGIRARLLHGPSRT